MWLLELSNIGCKLKKAQTLKHEHCGMGRRGWQLLEHKEATSSGCAHDFLHRLQALAWGCPGCSAKGPRGGRGLQRRRQRDRSIDRDTDSPRHRLGQDSDKNSDRDIDRSEEGHWARGRISYARGQIQRLIGGALRSRGGHRRWARPSRRGCCAGGTQQADRDAGSENGAVDDEVQVIENCARGIVRPRYRAPEVLSNSQIAAFTAKLDIITRFYSASMDIYFLLNGRRPENDFKIDPRWREKPGNVSTLDMIETACIHQ